MEFHDLIKVIRKNMGISQKNSLKSYTSAFQLLTVGKMVM